MLLAAVWLDKKKPSIANIMSNMVQELGRIFSAGTVVSAVLYKMFSGVSIVPFGTRHQPFICKVRLLFTSLDSVAKAPVMRFKGFNATSPEGGGCPVCCHPGERVRNCFAFLH